MARRFADEKGDVTGRCGYHIASAGELHDERPAMHFALCIQIRHRLYEKVPFPDFDVVAFIAKAT
jgi:hypothetical protein